MPDACGLGDFVKLSAVAGRPNVARYAGHSPTFAQAIRLWGVPGDCSTQHETALAVLEWWPAAMMGFHIADLPRWIKELWAEFPKEVCHVVDCNTHEVIGYVVRLVRSEAT